MSRLLFVFLLVGAACFFGSVVAQEEKDRPRERVEQRDPPPPPRSEGQRDERERRPPMPPNEGERRGPPFRNGPRDDEFGPNSGPRREGGEQPGMRREGRFDGPNSGPPRDPRFQGPPHPGGGQGPGQFGPPHDLEQLKKMDPEMYELEVSDRELERTTFELSQRYRNVPKDQQGELKEQIQQTIAKHFEVRQKRRQMQLDRMERDLKRMRDELSRRNESRDQIIQRRLSELIGERSELDF